MEALEDVTRPNNFVPLSETAVQIAAIQQEASRLQWALQAANRSQRHARTNAERKAADIELKKAELNAQQWLALVPVSGISEAA